MPRVLITGATGFVGRAVTARFLAGGWSVAVLSRAPAAPGRFPTPVETLPWPRADLPPHAALRDLDAVVHLAGAPIAGGPFTRWTKARKETLRRSRVETTRTLIAALSRSGARPAAFVSASGMGYYGKGEEEGGHPVHPDDPPGKDFLAGLAGEWEREVAAARSWGARVVPVRLGMVLGGDGGALPKLKIPFSLGLGAVLGSGRQYWPWIHRDDAAELFFRAACDPAFDGPAHGAAGEPVTQRTFAETLARVLRRPLLLKMPAPLLRLGMGEMADLFLHGQRALPDPRFTPRHATLTEALSDL